MYERYYLKDAFKMACVLADCMQRKISETNFTNKV